MAATNEINRQPRESPGLKWGPMVILSLCFHLAIFLAIIFVPDTIPAGHIKGTVYEVDLVTLPAAVDSKQPESSSKSKKLTTSAKKKTIETKRITVQKPEEKPLIVAKRTLETKKIKPKKKTLSSSQLIDRAISKIENRVKKEDHANHVDQAIRNLEKKAGQLNRSGQRGGNGSAVAGVSINYYQMEVTTHIKSNWSYPTALRDTEDLEAIVIIKADRSGRIISFRFKKRSADSTFNESVIKAVERSEPLPPFPEVFRKRDEEIEVNFNLKDLKS